MKFSQFFIRRPIFASVISIFITLIGLLSLLRLPIASFPEVAPPTVIVRARFPGANPEVVATTVATPLEQEINGVEDMLYMSSTASADGSVSISVTFKVGTDIDKAQVLVQNRVALALPKLPEECRRLGVEVRKRSPNMTMVVVLQSDDESLDEIFLSNYAQLYVKDVLARLPGVGDVFVFGTRDYSMRIWLDPQKIASLNMTVAEVVAAVREQNIEVAGGAFGQQPAPRGTPMQLVAQVKGRLVTPAEFENIVIRTDADGRIVRLRDVARVELGARDYSIDAYLDGKPVVAIAIFQLPGSNTIETAAAVRGALAELSKTFPKGMSYFIPRDDSEYIKSSIHEVIKTLVEAMILVSIVVILFLQTWRASIIPIVAVPVSIIGTFAAMAAFGFSINNLTLFGLVLAIGIVVDDAIVVVENVERHIAEGKSPAEAASIAMDEIGGAVIAIALVLSAVFFPTAFLPGIQGKFYQQFALTIAVSTLISALVALTLSPALCALLLQPHHEKNDLVTRALHATVGKLFKGFNRLFESGRNVYTHLLARLIRRGGVMTALYCGLMVLAWLGFRVVPGGFIPAQDQRVLICYLQLPDGASLERTKQVSTKVWHLIKDVPGVERVLKLDGFSMLGFGVQPNASTIMVRLKSYEERKKANLYADNILLELRKRLVLVNEGFAMAFNVPAVQGLGSVGGFRMQIQDRANLGWQVLQASAMQLMAAANQDPRFSAVLTTFRANVPQVFLDVDREKAKTMQVPLSAVWDTLAVYLGGLYVNDFNIFGRPYQVVAQADAPFRAKPENLMQLWTRNANGEKVPLGTLVKVVETTGPTTVSHYNMYPSADLSGSTRPGVSSGEAIRIMSQLAARILPPGIGYEWTELTLLEIMAGKTAVLIFPLCILMVFLVLAAQYESWALPLAIILIAPMSLLFAIAALWARGMENNLFAQIGMVTLIGLACKNAILVVEFARQLQTKGMTRFDAAVEAARIRLRPILMTSFAFTAGVFPLMIATGAGAELRRAIGTTAFWGMLGVTLFGLFFTPVFYVVIRRIFGERGTASGAARASGSARATGITGLILGTGLGSMLLAGCAVGPEYKRPELTTPAVFTGASNTVYTSTGEIEIRWWGRFNDPTLDGLVARALESNHDLRIAEARVREARALRAVSTLDLLPTIHAGGGFTKSLGSKDAYPGMPRPQRERELYDAGFDATWELDLFGRVRRSRQAATAELAAAEAMRRFTLVSLIAELTRNYFELRGLQEQLRVARSNAALASTTYELVRAKYNAGRGSELDLARARAQMETANAAVPTLEAAVQQTIHRLSVLCGQPPDTLSAVLADPGRKPTIPASIPVPAPDTLLRRRPDIQAAEHALAAATARIGVAVADLFPRVTFNGQLGLQAHDPSGLTESGADSYSFGPRLSWAALDLGRVAARIRAARARADAQLANYEKTVLQALEETEDALVSHARVVTQHQHLLRATEAARTAFELASKQYEAGAIELLTLLDAQRNLLALEQQLAQSETRVATSLVAVYKAFGGGWEIGEPPARHHPR